jgi:hypothetical protein
MTNECKVPRRWYNPAWWDGTLLPTEPILYSKLREGLEAAVCRQATIARTLYEPYCREPSTLALYDALEPPQTTLSDHPL